MPRPAPVGAPRAPAVEIHPDFQVLEERLVAILRDLKESTPDGALAPALVVAPSRLLLGHLREILAGRFPAGLLHVRFLHHDGLVHAIAAQAGVALPSPLRDEAKQAILGEVARQASGELRDFVRARPGCVAALLSTMEDLREAGIDPATATGIADLSSEGRTLLDLYGAYAGALGTLTRQGWSDRAGRVAAILPHAAAFGDRFRQVIHYGAYELIGINRDLMGAIERSGRPVVYLAPGHPTAPAFSFAVRFWRETAAVDPALLADRIDPRDGSRHGGERDRGARLLGDRLTLLYDDKASAPPAERPLGLFHAQGSRSELIEAALRVLARHRSHGTPLSRQAILARSLEPYAPLLAPVFKEHGLPIHTSASLGAARDPHIQAALSLARCLLDDFPCGSLFDLLRSGQYRADPEPLRDVDAWERLAREYRIAGGASVFTIDLPRWVASREPKARQDVDEARREKAAEEHAERRRLARGLAQLVGELEREALSLKKARTWTDCAECFRTLLLRRIAGFHREEAGDDVTEGSAAAAEALALLAGMEALDVGGVPLPSPASILGYLERAVARATLPIGSVDADGAGQRDDQGGLRVLDLMSARGLAFDAVHFVGMNADLLPRRVREDPFLPDDDRRRVRKATGRPLKVAADALDEEHLLLAHLAGSARDQLTVSWQRADEEGKARVPALALREFGRVALSTTDQRAVERRALQISAHPADQAIDAVRRHRLLAPGEAALASALLARGPRAAETLFGRMTQDGIDVGLAQLLPGLRFLDAIEGGPEATAYDCLPGEVVQEDEVWSPSRLETLGSCPQQYFFRHLLRVPEWEEPREPHEIEGREMGAVVHKVLHDVYEGLSREGWLDGSRAAPAVLTRADALLEPSWAARASGLQARIGGRYPALWDLIRTEWLSALRRFMRLDLAETLEAGRALLGVETEAQRLLPVGVGGPDLAVRGRFDRLGRDRDGELVISDYKSSGRLEPHVNTAEMLKGGRLQMGLYLLMAEADATNLRKTGVRAEVLGVGPGYSEDEMAAMGPARATLDSGRFNDIREGLLETLGVISKLARRGLFPLNDMSRLCRFCPFSRACRRDHLPTLERLAGIPDLRHYFSILRKNTQRPLLADVAPDPDGPAEADP